MNKICLLTGIIVMLLFTSCREEFDDHFSSDSTVGKNVVQILQEHSDLSLFAKLIERAGLTRTLGESGIYTVLAPRNKDVEAWLNEQGCTVDNIPLNVLMPWINYHFVTGRNYLFDLEKKYDEMENYDFDTYPYYYVYYSGGNILRSTRGDKTYDPKFIRLFTPKYFAMKADDYKLMRGVEPGDFMAEGVRISASLRDMPASNGVVHVLDGPLPLAPRCDEAIMAENDCSIVQGWLRLFRREEIKSENSGSQIDTVTIPVYNISQSSTGKVCNIADEKLGYTVLLPTDNAVRASLGKYMTEEYLGTNYDSIPKPLLVSILQSLFYKQTLSGNYASFGISDFNEINHIPSYNGAILSLKNDLSTMYQSSVLSSNAVIYKIDQMPLLPIFTSIEAGLYVNKKHYSEFHKLMEVTGNSPAFTDEISYQHIPHTFLLQPDDVWNKKLEDYEENYYDSLYFDIRSVGDLIENVQDGNFEHKYYLNASGFALLYENGVFTDPLGNQLELISKKPLYTAESGAIYDVKGFGKMFYRSDTTYTVAKQMSEIPEISRFVELCKKAGVYNTLKQVNVNLYSVFAPLNDAFDAAGINESTYTEKEAKELVEKHLILNRQIFTDGQTKGKMFTLKNLEVEFSGEWENFTISTTYNRNVGFVSGKTDVQCSNGILHCIKKILLN
ncbi:MAG: fasciclin domain-containing protein [Odoribacter sp.]